MRSVAVLGATGSIGRQALDVIAGSPELRVCGLSANRDAEGLAAAARATGARRVALVDADAAGRAARDLDGVTVHRGEEGVEELIAASGADLVLNAIVGAAGLRATLAAFAAGADVALANKESLVAGGELVLAACSASGRRLLPVDSEHSALAQCLEGAAPDTVTGLVITASGGPFRGRRRDELADVTPAEALAHPTWSMGEKITIDSATLMNKGLEVIEAHHLFGVPYEAVEVVVHPQSIVHGMVRFRDGALLAHAGLPDMRVPISWALTHPHRGPTAVAPLDLSTPLSLDFAPADVATFRCLALAREAGMAGGTAPCVLNAANEVAVRAFLDGRIGFLDIAAVVEEALAQVPSEPLVSLEQVLDADRRARAAAAGAGAAAA
jgi:1-deoxy-D-xylulose-5-phosphate reductoisomerase